MFMKAIIAKYWFFAGLALAFLTAFQFPGLARAFKEYKVVDTFILLAFFFTGLTLDTSRILEQLTNYKVMAASLLSSLLLSTALAFAVGKTLVHDPDFFVGMMIIGAAPVTVASGSVMTAIALGNVPMSLFICVISNLASLISIPFVLQMFLSLSEGIKLPVWDLLSKLLFTLLLPTLVGQLVRLKLKDKVDPYLGYISIFMQFAVVLIVFNAAGASSSRIMNAGGDLVWVLAVMLLLHVLILMMNYGISRLLSLDRAATSAFTIHNSQKTLTISYVVWTGFFAVQYPMALIPGIAYHLLQMVVDTIVARFRRKQAETALAAGRP